MNKFIPLLAITSITFFGGSHVRAQASTVEVTGGDAGQGLTLDASNAVRAYNINGNAVTVQGVSFTPFLLASSFSGSVNFNPGENSGNDVELLGMLSSLAWNGVNGELQLTFSGLTANSSYRLDLLQSTATYASREQAIVANGQLVTLVNLIQGSAYNTSFTAEADAAGSIALTVVRSGIYGGTGNQDGAVLNGVALTAIPEPSAVSMFVGISALACGGWRRRGVRLAPNR